MNHTIIEAFAVESQIIEYIPGELFSDFMLINMVAVYNDRADTAKKVDTSFLWQSIEEWRFAKCNVSFKK